VFLAYASARGHALINRELHLRNSWADDADRSRAVGIPPEVDIIGQEWPPKVWAEAETAYTADELSKSC
jgi:hypothetical protein